MALPKGMPRPCKGCGKTILKLKFCANECRVDWYARTASERERARGAAKGIQSWRERYPEGHLKLITRSCEYCGVEFTRRQRPRDAARFCSKICSGAKRTADKIAAVPVPLPRYCDCGSELEARRLRCAPCAAERARVQTRDWYYRERGRPTCLGCGTFLPNDGSYMRRCEPCRVAHAASQRRIGRAIRKRRVQNAVVERFDPLEVLERDGWKCHICGRRTPKRLRGTYDDRAPEVDHVVPLAAGGEHSRRNTACACRRCNIAKGSKPLGQLRLVA